MTDTYNHCHYHSLMRKILRYSNFHRNSQENNYPQDNGQHQTKLSSFYVEPKIIYDEIWLSNKQYNARVAAYMDNVSDKTKNNNNTTSNNNNNNNNLTSFKRKSSRTCTYQVRSGQIIHERIYPATMKAKLGLRVAVNGASKSMRGQLPLSNLNLLNGDFGDDAGMIVENRDYCFLGKFSTTKKESLDKK